MDFYVKLAHNLQMIKIFILLCFGMLYSCSQVSLKRDREADLVSLRVALDQARSSYLKGCVDAFHELKIPKAFQPCLEKAKDHEREIIEILNQ